MAIEGMDVAAVESINRQMSSQLTALQHVMQQMPGLINQLEGSWKGQDASQFAQQWPAHQSRLQAAVDALDQICQRTKRNLDQQRTTSQQLL